MKTSLLKILTILVLYIQWGVSSEVYIYPLPIDIKTQVVPNPHKGWVLYDNVENLYSHPEILQLGPCGYNRFNWKDLEPTEGNFNWALIDNRITSWKTAGKKFAFRIMAANTHAGTGDAGLYVTPQWVFDAGCAYIDYYCSPDEPYKGYAGYKRIPVWNDPVFKQKVKNLLDSVAARYDTSRQIEFIDVGTYGNWGEQWGINNYLSNAELQEHISWYLTTFKHIMVVNVMGLSTFSTVYDWCVNNGISVRRDGLLGDSPQGDELVRAYDKVPGIYEWHRNYKDARTGGFWSNDDHEFWTSLYNGRPTLQSSYWAGVTYNDPVYMWNDGRGPLMIESANRLGYHFVITEAGFDSIIGNGAVDTFCLKIKNIGLAPIYFPVTMKLAMMDNSKNVLALCTLHNINLFSVKPYDKSSTLYSEKHAYTFPFHANGNKLAIGLFSDTAGTAPDMNFGVLGKDSSGWYILSDLPTTAPIPVSIKIAGNNVIKIPAAGSASVNYSATATDHDGNIIDNLPINWKLESPVSGVSVDSNTGVVTVDNNTTTVYFTLLATNKAVTGRLTVLATPLYYAYSDNFSSTQGHEHWYYRYYVNDTLYDMHWDAVNLRWQGNETWLLLAKTWFHPGNEGDAIAQWVAPIAGSVSIVGITKKWDISCGDGLVTSIKQNNVSRWGPFTIAFNDSVSRKHDLPLKVSAGDTLSFSVNKNSSNDWCDGFLWNPTIYYLPDSTTTRNAIQREPIPESFTVYPNPGNPGINLRFYLKDHDKVTIEIFNTTGMIVSSPVNQYFPSGHFTHYWNGRNNANGLLPSGIYWVRLSTTLKIETRRILLLK